MTPEETEARQRYPQYAWMLDIPDIGPILLQATKEGWPPERLQGAIEGSTWWTTTAASIRSYWTLANTDPATFNSSIQSIADRITGIAAADGFGIAAERIYELAKTAFYLGRQDDTAYLRRLVASDSAVVFGADSPIITTMRQQVADYGVPLSDSTLWDWGRKIASGDYTQDSFQAYLIEQAKTLYPTLSDALDRGITVRQYFDPYVQIAAKELGINPESISLSDSRWNRALVNVDPTTGQRVPMGLDQWTRTIRTDPIYGWDTTTAAREQAAQFASQTLQRFGMAS